jgi:hypothetical protein
MKNTTHPDLLALLRMRKDQDLWDKHPIIAAKATLPTGPMGAAIPLVIEQGRRQRGCVAFWAHPFTGKSSCIRALEAALIERFPGCGIALHEAKSNTVIAEGTFIADILHTLEYEGKIQYSLAEKREQIRRAFFALGAERRHVIFIIDEAQELAEQEFRWLKEQGNWLTKKGYKVTVVLFGQQELITVKNELITTGRSDLAGRFFAHMFEYEPIKRFQDLECFLAACDEKSEYPEGSGWCYTRFLWPRAYDAGFRLLKQAEAFFKAFASISPLQTGEQGIGMNYIAESLACLADMTRERDTDHFEPTVDDWKAAVDRAGYADRDPLVRKPERKLKVSAQRAVAGA